MRADGPTLTARIVDLTHDCEGVADIDGKPGDTSARAVLEMSEYAFNERMAGREEVDGLVFDRLLTIERADKGQSAGNTGKAVD